MEWSEVEWILANNKWRMENIKGKNCFKRRMFLVPAIKIKSYDFFCFTYRKHRKDPNWWRIQYELGKNGSFHGKCTLTSVIISLFLSVSIRSRVSWPLKRIIHCGRDLFSLFVFARCSWVMINSGIEAVKYIDICIETRDT